MRRLRRAVRAGGWVAVAGTVLAAAGMLAPDRHVGLGRLGAGVVRGRMTGEPVRKIRAC